MANKKTEKTLVIVESPSKAKTISKFLDNNFKVVSSMGHIRDLPNKKFGIEIEKEQVIPEYINNKDKTKLISELKKEYNNAENLLIATDEDREGEAIGWHLLHILKPKTYDRIVFHEITKQAILQSLKSPRKISESLVNAQQARRILDRIVGYKLSPLLWKKIAKGLSAGRVQSVALKIIAMREKEIKNFVPKSFFNIKATISKDKQKLETLLVKIDKDKIQNPTRDKEGKFFIDTIKKAEQIQQDIESSKNFVLKNIKKVERKTNPSPPFNTSTLQQSAGNKLGFSVKKTMMVAQKLYEGIDLSSERTGLITYMRTDSFYIAESAISSIRNFIKSNFGDKYLSTTKRIYKSKSKNAQEAHEAIRPVNINYTPEKIKQYLSPDEYKLYNLIWNKTVALQMTESLIEKQTLLFVPENDDKYIFQYETEKVLFDGFLKVYDKKDSFVDLNLQQNDKLKKEKLDIEQSQTSPPPRYTESSLVKKMESLGVGRPSTYAPTISTIQTRNYIEKDGKYLIPTDVGMLVNDFLMKHFDYIIDYDFTANLEDTLDKIADNKADWQKMIIQFYNDFTHIIEQKEKNIEKYSKESDEKCEKCGADMIIKMGRYGEFLACSGFPNCKNIKPLKKDMIPQDIIDKYKHIKCDKCKSSTELKKGKFGFYFECFNDKCKHRQPLVEKIGVKCPDCKKGEFIIKKTRKGKVFYACDQYPKCKTSFWQKPTDYHCPLCKHILLESSKDKLRCPVCKKYFNTNEIKN